MGDKHAFDQLIAESKSLLDRWRAEYPGTTLGELHKLDPELVEALLRNKGALDQVAPDVEDDDDDW
jgi:hypothetical protein